MEEVNVGFQGETSQWQDRPRDPNLEIAFMGRLMETFGLTNAQAKQLITQARPASERVVTVDESSGVPLIVVNDSLDRVWLRVGLALDRSDFVVDSSNRASSVFTVRESDPVRDSERRSGLFGKLFGGSKVDAGGKTAYQVNLRALPDGHTQIGVLDASGRPDGSRQARRLVTILRAQLS
jgi:outer membrane protein assembly factor BamC